ncbi:unnamed protein product [Urochloa humidicola]
MTWESQQDFDFKIRRDGNTIQYNILLYKCACHLSPGHILFLVSFCYQTVVYMASIIGWALLLCLVRLHPLVASSAHADGNLTNNHSTPSSCRPDQANALLKLKQSFMFHSYSPFHFGLPDSSTTLPSWQAGTDCCLWEGVGCSDSSGHVTALNLGGFGLYSKGIDPVLFNLTSLRLLDLSMNDFGGLGYSELPPVGFERLALLTHLNLSGSGFSGQCTVSTTSVISSGSRDPISRP